MPEATPFLSVDSSNIVATCPEGSACEVRPFDYMACTVGVNDANCASPSTRGYCCPAGSTIQFRHTLPDGMQLVTCSAPSDCAVPPVDGGWSDWSSCASNCRQTRTCANPAPQNGGANCVGESTQVCTGGQCRVDGGWTNWGSCDSSCQQYRTCTDPAPENGGATCPGYSFQTCSGGECGGSGGTDVDEFKFKSTIYTNPGCSGTVERVTEGKVGECLVSGGIPGMSASFTRYGYRAPHARTVGRWY